MISIAMEISELKPPVSAATFTVTLENGGKCIRK
jgi:hypothetical protein